MKNLHYLFMTLCLAAASSTSAFAQESYPELYLRGDGSLGNWEVNEKFRFQNDGNLYTIHLDQLQSEFKISNSDWTINYGGSGLDNTINESVILEGIQDGKNWHADANDVNISFRYNNSGITEVKFVINGVNIDDPSSALTSGSLPILYINVYTDATHSTLNNEIISKDLNHKNYFSDAEYWLDLNGCEWLEAEGGASVGSKESPLPLEIKARGNYTRTGFAKKPFKLKLGKKQNLLGLTPSKSKHYAILAHADDNYGYLRNFTGFNLGQRIGLPWTPSQQPIEVVINGDYRGLYFLTESIRIEEGRINITELDDNVSDPQLVSGGYLVELDNYDEDNQIQFYEKPFATGDPIVRVTFDTPEVYSALQLQFIKDQFESINDRIGDNSDDIWRYLDLDDAVRYYLVEEILSHTESYHGSTYLFRDYGEGQKWHFSPLWDFGNAFNGSTSDYFWKDGQAANGMFGNTWVHSFTRNEKFMNKARETWKWFMSNCYDGVISDIDAYVDHLRLAAKADRKRWENAPRPNSDVATDVVDNSDMTGRRNAAVSHLQAKVDWMKQEFGDYTDRVYPEPERDATPAAPLPEYIISGIDEIPAEIADKDNEPVFYNLQGIRIDNPQAGVYIMTRGKESKKVTVK